MHSDARYARAPWLVAAAFALAACGGPPQPGEPGYAYNVDGEYAAEFDTDDGTVYTGTMRLETGPGGQVTGTMSLVNPAAIDGTVEGLVVGADLSMTVDYIIVDQGCGGVATGGGVIEEGGSGVSGSVEISDECGGGAPLSATFTLGR